MVTCDPHFPAGFFCSSTKKFRAPSMRQYEKPTSRWLKSPAAPVRDIAYLLHVGAAALVHPKQVTVPVNIAVTNEPMLKRTLCIDSHTNLLATAAYQNVSAALDQAQAMGCPWTSILTLTKDLLYATSYSHRDSMKYAASYM